jgi:hypothetical protein
MCKKNELAGLQNLEEWKYDIFGSAQALLYAVELLIDSFTSSVSFQEIDTIGFLCRQASKHSSGFQKSTLS